MPAESVNSAPTPAPLDRERDRPHPLQIELYRRATPTQKLAAVARLNATLLKLKETSLESQFPHLSSVERRALLRHWWLTAHD
ncbi:MAG: hypothetical protein HZA93_07775 [Verrucomicrobia bacterium]|nr:hypothetical protein [Verrucomicrobiota bacterium]